MAEALADRRPLGPGSFTPSPIIAAVEMTRMAVPQWIYGLMTPQRRSVLLIPHGVDPAASRLARKPPVFGVYHKKQ